MSDNLYRKNSPASTICYSTLTFLSPNAVASSIRNKVPSIHQFLPVDEIPASAAQELGEYSAVRLAITQYYTSEDIW